MANSNDQQNAYLGDDDDVSNFDQSPYFEYDKPALIALLCRKDELLKQKTNDMVKLQAEIEILKEKNNQLHKALLEKELIEEDPKDDCMSSAQEKDFAEKPMPDWTLSTNNDTDISIHDAVRATVEAEFSHLQSVQQDAIFTDSKAFNNDHDTDVDSEYVYDMSSGYYYHPPTGYYWDPASGLFYDYTTRTYYKYNDANEKYEVHSQVEIEGQNITAKISDETHPPLSSQSKCSYSKTMSSLKTKASAMKKQKNRVSKKRRGQCKGDIHNKERKKVENAPNNILSDAAEIKADEGLSVSGCESSGSLGTDESELMSDPESGEIISSSSSDVELLDEQPPIQHMTYTSEPKPYEEAMVDSYPPCIRVIVQESEKLYAGTLFIVTCMGGTIGREPAQRHCIEIPDIGVSKIHASIFYDYNDSLYKVEDLGSQNGTRVNGNKVHQGEHNRQALTHGDVLELGMVTKLLLHIHKGHETCEECEPGQIQAKLKALNSVKPAHVVMTKNEKKQNQRKELKKIKKKYGLQNSYFENDGAVVNNPDFADKAYLRRKFIGSEHDSASPMIRPASVNRPIESSNKGHRLLAKMGWKEGQGLGKTNDGISEPINVGLRVDQSSGLGSQGGHAVSLDHVQDSSKAKRWSQARQRFNLLQTPTPADPTQDVNLNTYPSQKEGENINASSSPLKVTFENIDKETPSPLPESVSESSSSMTSILLSSSTNLSTCVSGLSKYDPKIKWHKGETERLSTSDICDSDNNKIS